jgi:hypothetical protein
MKKRITAVLAIAVLTLALLPTTAFAHGHKGAGTQRTDYSVCTVENCNATGAHKHGNAYYAGHSAGDGHAYHELCPVQGCTKTAAHDHDGATYFGHHREDGHSYHNGGHRGGGGHR